MRDVVHVREGAGEAIEELDCSVVVGAVIVC